MRTGLHRPIAAADIAVGFAQAQNDENEAHPEVNLQS